MLAGESVADVDETATDDAEGWAARKVSMACAADFRGPFAVVTP
jgi:hypothetical protein